MEMKRDISYNRGHLHKNYPIEDYRIPEIGQQRSHKRKYTISRFQENLSAAHNHEEFRQQFELQPLTYAIRESDIVKQQHTYRRHSRIVKSDFGFMK
jgi:hypothetical protein